MQDGKLRAQLLSLMHYRGSTVDFLTIEFITDMVLWISILVSALLSVLIIMIYFKDNWFEPNKEN